MEREGEGAGEGAGDREREREVLGSFTVNPGLTSTSKTKKNLHTMDKIYPFLDNI